MATPTLELHETMIRLTKGIISARKRLGAQVAVTGPIAAVLEGSPLAGLLGRPTSELEASIGLWENRLKLERTKAPA